MDRKFVMMARLTLAVSLFGVVFVAMSAAPPSEPDNCDWVAAGKGPSLSAAQCTADAKSCAVELNRCLGGFNYADSDKWWLFTAPEGLRQNVAAPRHVNHQTPQHGRYLSVYVNETARDALQEILDMPVAPEDVDLPDGSVIAKLNYTGPESQPEPPWLTVMAKIDGYCPETVGGTCNGGDWFYYLNRFGNFLSFEELIGVTESGAPIEGGRVPAFGKPSAFCTDCHNPVEKADFLWSLGAALWKTKPVVKREASASYQPADAVGGITPADLCAPGTVSPSPRLPPDVAVPPSQIQNPVEAQRMFDCFSWRSFVALNWTADPRQRGQPAPTLYFTVKSGERVWESYKETFEVFQPGDPDWTVKPDQWNERAAIPEACKSVIDGLSGDALDAFQSRAPKALQMVSKTRANQVLNETHQAFGNQFNILIDQEGRLVRYEVRFNQDEFQYLSENGFADTGAYSYAGPKNVKDFSFPTNRTGLTRAGSIEIKAAWRELCAGPVCTAAEEKAAKRYYAVPALKYVPGSGKRPAQCSLIGKAGLIGLHMVRKTENAPQWIWSTFEHIDNVPPANQAPTPGVDYTLYNPQCDLPDFKPSQQACASQRPGILPSNKRPDFSSKRAECCANLQLMENAFPEPVKTALGLAATSKAKKLLRNHVTRLDPIGPTFVNSEFARMIRSVESDNPFQYYVLVNTQWARGARNPNTREVRTLSCAQRDFVDRDGAPCYTIMPRNGADSLRLRNTTMETFQVSIDDGPDAKHFSSAGCMNCHGDAGTDFSFVFLDAQEISTPIKAN